MSKSTSKLQLPNPEEQPSVYQIEVNKKVLLKSTPSNCNNDSDKLSAKGLSNQQEQDDSTGFDSFSLHGVQSLPCLIDEIKDISKILLNESSNVLSKE